MASAQWGIMGCLLLCGLLVSVCEATVSDDLSKLFINLANDGLGVQEFQDHLNKRVKHEETELDGRGLITEVSAILEDTFRTARGMVTDIRKKVENVYDDLDTTPRFFDCCHPPHYVSFTHNDQLKTAVNTDYLCYVGAGNSVRPVKYLDQSIVDVMKENYRKHFEAKWQYIGTEEGVMFIYPASKNCVPASFDPRFRSWYVATAAQKPKDVVVVIDKSGSMGQSTQSGETLMHVAKEAAKTVIDTLNPNDRIGLIAFSDNAQTPTQPDVPGCYSSSMALGTPTNKKNLKKLVDNIRSGGGTLYVNALEAAFRLLSNQMSNETINGKIARDSVILFLTDGQPTDRSTKEQSRQFIMRAIHEHNAKMRNKVVILTFGIGGAKDSASQILTDMAMQTGADENVGPIKKGEFTAVAHATDLRGSMASYYNFFVDMEESFVMSVPYFDAFGLGVIVSQCSPVVTSKSLRGVACIDLVLLELVGAASFFRPGELSYAFMVDQHGRLTTHPLLPSLHDYYDDPLFVNMLDVEREREAEEILASMLSGGNGNKTFSSRRVISRGDSVHDGVNPISVLSHYFWRQIDETNYSLCIVIADKDRMVRYTQYEDFSSFLYHRLDLVTPSSACNHFQQLATIDQTSVKFTPYAFMRPNIYTDKTETTETVKLYTDIMLKKSTNTIFRDGVREAVAITASVNKNWLSKDGIEKTKIYSVWKYVGTHNGVFRMFPASPLYKSFDHTGRPWYRKAISSNQNYILTPPYFDAGGSGVIMTLAKAVFEGSTSGAADYVFGVMGLDFSVQRFYALVKEISPDCATPSVSCLAMDNSGHLVFHNDFSSTESEKRLAEQIHITDKEPDIAEHLINGNYMKKESCVDVSNMRENNYWRVEMPISQPSIKVELPAFKYELHHIRSTNIYFIKKYTGPNTANCNCPKKKKTSDAYVDCGMVFSCQCPCSKSTVFDYCINEFPRNSERAPVCRPDSPPVTDTATLGNKKAVNYPQCLNYDCPAKSTKSECDDNVGCDWCNKGNKCISYGEECSDGSGTLGTGTIVGICIAVLVVIAIIAFAGVKILKARQVKGTPPSATSQQGNVDLSTGVQPTAPAANQSHDGYAVPLQSHPYNPAYDNKGFNDNSFQPQEYPPPYTPYA